MTSRISSESLTQAAKKVAEPVNISRSQSQGDAKDIRHFAIELCRLSSELKCEQVSLIDVRGRSQICEYMVVASGTSDRQMKSVADQLKAFGAQHGMPRWKRDRDTNGTWIAADFVDVVVHLFEPTQRAWYDLEGMWADSPRVDWKRSELVKSAAVVKSADASNGALVNGTSETKIAAQKSVSKKVAAKKPAAKKLSKKVSAKKPAAKKSSKKVSAKKPVTVKKSDVKTSKKKPSSR